MKSLRLAALAATFALAGAQQTASAQSLDRKFEIGGQGGLVTTVTGGDASGLVGGRFGYNFTDRVAVEAEVNAFPGTSALEGLFGVKAGVRGRKVGVFAKARPGVVTSFDGAGTTAFATDVGGVLEFYPTERTIVRVDVGDTILFRNDRATNVLQVSGGFGFRF